MSKKELKSIDVLNSEADVIIELVEDFISSLDIKQEKRQKPLISAGRVSIPGLDRITTNVEPSKIEYYTVDVWDELSPDNSKKQTDILNKYEKWYAASIPVIIEHSPERLDDFKAHYDSIIDCINLEIQSVNGSTEKMRKVFMNSFRVQKIIVFSLSAIIKKKTCFFCK
jgi:hypothetical protein